MQEKVIKITEQTRQTKESLNRRKEMIQKRANLMIEIKALRLEIEQLDENDTILRYKLKSKRNQLIAEARNLRNPVVRIENELSEKLREKERRNEIRKKAPKGGLTYLTKREKS